MEWANEKKKPTAEELDGIRRDFYTELKKNDGSEYEPEPLGVMQASLDRYLIKRTKAITESHYPSAQRHQVHSVPRKKKKCCGKKNVNVILQS